MPVRRRLGSGDNKYRKNRGPYRQLVRSWGSSALGEARPAPQASGVAGQAPAATSAPGSNKLATGNGAGGIRRAGRVYSSARRLAGGGKKIVATARPSSPSYREFGERPGAK